MRNLLAGIATLAILIGTVGWGRAWYAVEGLPADSGKFAFRVEFDPMKMGGDVTDAFRYLHSKLSARSKEDAESK